MGSSLFAFARRALAPASTAALALAVPLLVNVACSGFPLGRGGDGGADGASPATDAGANRDAPNTLGLYCGRDPVSGVELCLGVATCPNNLVDQDAFPECGFRFEGDKYDFVCLCDNELCPVGPVTRCTDITALMERQSAQSVCAQRGEGRCVPARLR
jgi:hypothetical protein